MCAERVLAMLLLCVHRGTHHDPAFEALLPEVLQAERAKETHSHCVAPLLTAGSALIFDIRVLHRGRANFSPHNRSVRSY
jgi:hypothetical protein|eukprot:COSAG06_NODE_3937_length_4746_cov_15.304231_3_plen_80_part_00